MRHQDKRARAKLRAFTLLTLDEAKARMRAGEDAGTVTEADYGDLTPLFEDRDFMDAAQDAKDALPCEDAMQWGKPGEPPPAPGRVPFAGDVARCIDALKCEFVEWMPNDPAKAREFGRFVADVFEAGQAFEKIKAMTQETAATNWIKQSLNAEATRAAAAAKRIPPDKLLDMYHKARAKYPKWTAKAVYDRIAEAVSEVENTSIEGGAIKKRLQRYKTSLGTET